MRKERVYIICPLTVRQEFLSKVARKAMEKSNIEVSYYNRNTIYSDKNLKEADTIIIILPCSSFRYSINSLPEGSKKELNSVLGSKSIYLGYESSQGVRLYQTTIIPESNTNSNCISGLAGTYEHFFKNTVIFEDIKEELV